MDGGASQSSGRADAPITPEMLADLQAGLLDDATAARVRRRARTDPEAARQLAALDRVRRELAELGADEASAADVPAAVTARVGAALQAVPLKREVPPAPSGHHVLGATGRRAAAHAVRGSLPRSRRLRRLVCARGSVRRRRRGRPRRGDADPAAAVRHVHAGRPPSTSRSRPRRAIFRCPTRRSSGYWPTGPTTARSPTRNAGRPASTAWATRRPPRCSAPGPWTCRGARQC